jgi:tripeptidyl-peptidase-1
MILKFSTLAFVTSVGGTVFIEPEEAVYFSSGGFSETWPMPSYQESAVETYFAANKDQWEPFVKYFVKTGRGFPDVAAMADNFQVVIKGKLLEQISIVKNQR